MKPKFLPGFMSFLFCITLIILFTTRVPAQDTISRYFGVSGIKLDECPQLKYEAVFVRQPVCYKDMWLKSIRDEYEAAVNEKHVYRSYVQREPAFTEYDREKLQAQSKVLRESCYLITLQQYRIELISVNFESVIREIMTKP